MSLLDDNMVNCTMLDKTTTDDGYGGTKVVYKDGAAFKAAITLNSSMEARIAEQQGVTSLYTVTTKKNVNLQFHDIFRREEDKKIFRVTSDGDDNKTPKGAGLDMRQVTAEEYTLPASV